MNIAPFIARRITFNKQKSFSGFIIRLATVATALSVAAMIITLAFVNGFQKTVSEKVFGFWGHMRVQQFEGERSIVAEETPLDKNDSVVSILKRTPGIVRVQPFATKSAVLDKDREIEGVLFKGVESNYNFKNLDQFLVEGRWINFSDTLYSKEINVSQAVAKLLNMKVNDTIAIYFISPGDGKTNTRRLRVAGIFKTGIEEFDKLFALGDIRLLRRVNNWREDQIGGYEIFLANYEQMDSINTVLYRDLPFEWVSKTLKEIYPNIFDWLSIQDMNRDVIFIIMAVVAIINLVTCLLILVLERTRMVGILKAVGARNITIQKIFLYNATLIATVGIGSGLVVGLGLCYLQLKTGFITMNETAYYVATAPVDIIWWQVAAVCAGTFLVCFLALTIPTLIVRGIKPVKAIQFR